MLVETGATAGALVPAVAELGAGEAAGEMGGEAPNWWQRRSGGRFASVTEKSVRLTAGTLQRLGDRLAYLDDGCVAVLELGRDEVDGDDPSCVEPVRKEDEFFQTVEGNVGLDVVGDDVDELGVVVDHV